jgi:hypothetical protein
MNVSTPLTTGPLMVELAADTGDDFGRAAVAELRVPRDEVLELHGRGDIELYERLLRDEQVYATFHQRRAGVVAREWKVEPGGTGALDVMAADHLREQLQHLSWDRTTYRKLTALLYGYGVTECMYAPDGGRVVLEALKVRRSRRFRFAFDGSLRLMRGGLVSGEVMPPRKFWTMTCGADDDDNPYGIGLGHWLYWPVWFKRNAIRFWSLFLERFSGPTATAQVPAGTSEPEREKVLAMLDRFMMGGRIVYSSGIKLDLTQSMRDSGGDYLRFVELMNAGITKVVLTQTMTTDDGASLAQGEVHERKGDVVAKSDADMLCESFMRGPAKWLTEWNFPGAATPLVYRDFSEAEDLKALADRDEALTRIGFRPTAPRVLEIYGEGYEPLAPALVAEVATPAADASPPDANASTAAPAPAVAPVEIPLTPTDVASIVTVNQALRSMGMSPKLGPEGELTVAQYQARNATTIAAANAATSGEAPAHAPAAAAASAAAFAEGAPETPESKAVERVAGGWREVLEPQVVDVERIAAECASLTELRDRLGEVGKTDPAQLTEALARLMFAARVEAAVIEENVADGE